MSFELFGVPLHRLLTLIGLLIDGFGAVLLVVPDLERPWSLEAKIENVEEARETLFTDGSIQQEDTGFWTLAEVSRKNLDIPGTLVEIYAGDPGKLGNSAKVEPRYVSEGADHKYAKPQPENLPSRTLFDRWIERHIHQLEREYQMRYFRHGARLLVVGFTIQIVAVGVQPV